MVDTKEMAAELKKARRARNEAEDAWCAVEELLWEMRHPRTWRRMAQTNVAEPEPLVRTH